LAPTLLLAALCIAAAVRVARITLEHAVIRSELIVVGEVTAVVEVPPPPEGWPAGRHGGVHTTLPRRHATARVLETWRGEPLEMVNFLASATWTCDTSTAVAGERAVLFLQDVGEPVLHITHSGRGRMPVTMDEDGVERVAWPTEIIPSAADEAVRGLPQARRRELPWLRERVARVVATLVPPSAVR
jgi:hypothetical protein